jgi:hypothetical protein
MVPALVNVLSIVNQRCKFLRQAAGTITCLTTPEIRFDVKLGIG